MATIETIVQRIRENFATQKFIAANGELTLELDPQNLLEVCKFLRDDEILKFEMLVDIAGVDYFDYGISEWVTNKATSSGFERAVDESRQLKVIPWNKPRFAVAYHLLSISHNHRIRLRVFLDEKSMMVPSVIKIWASADWYEREAFDLYGVLFEGHPDLRRLLTDYGFIGHPFRKDFPLSGNVEVRYDATLQRVIYEPVDIEPRILVPKVIRKEEDQAIKEAKHV